MELIKVEIEIPPEHLRELESICKDAGGMIPPPDLISLWVAMELARRRKKHGAKGI
jgi:hypothetical protein